MARVILAFVAIAVLSMAGVAAYQAGLAEAGEDNLEVNETFTPDAGNVTTLDESNRNGVYYAQNVTVYESGQELDAGADYRWIADNGTIKALAGGQLDGAASANITYAYQVTTKGQRDLAGVAGQVPRIAGLALPLGALLFLLLLVRGAA